MITARELATLLDLPAPTDEQAAVIEAGMSPAAVIAGAGAGKTETMATRVVWLVANEHVTPDQVLGLTFTRKAAAELGARVRRRLGQWRRVVERDRPDDVAALAVLQSGEATVSTYAAYAGRLVGEHALRVGAEPDARLLSPALLWQLADRVVRRWPGLLPEFRAISSLVHWVIAMSSQLADHLAEPADVAAWCEQEHDRFFALPRGPRARSDLPTGTDRWVNDALLQRRALMPLVSAFADAKAREKAMDFGDQMRLAARLAGVAEVAALERERYHAVLLDEYQDTGHAQVAMLRGLFGGGHPVTAVGDPFQSIYGWRGASAASMAAFDHAFPQADGAPASVFSLATSFRNDRAILVAANAVAAPLRTPHTVALRPFAGCGPGTVRTAFTETVEDEARWVAGRLRAAWHAMPVGDRTAAVLVRRRAQLSFLADAVRAEGLPVEIVGLGGLLTTPEVVDVVATLRVLGDDKPGGAVMRLLTGARWRVGPRDLAVLRDRARELAQAPDGADPEPASLVEALDDLGPAPRYSAEGHRRMARLGGELRALRARLAAPLAELVADVEHTIGVGVEVAARPDREQVGRVHLDRFLDVTAEFAAEAGDDSLQAFLAYLEAAEDEDNGLEAGEVVVAAERVQLLTVHGAKGLEWDLVAVTGLASDQFPALPRSVNWTRARQQLPAPLRGDRDQLPVLDLSGAASRVEIGALLSTHDAAVRSRHEEEERRLAYVALTRARALLLASGYAWDTTTKPRAPSPYLRTVAESAEPDEWFVVDPDAANPRLAEPITSPWPLDPLAPDRRSEVAEGAALVRAAAVAAAVAEGAVAGVVAGAAAGRRAGPGVRRAGAARPRGDMLDLPGVTSRADRWTSDVDRLLAERARRRASATIEVALPGHLSVSQLVELQQAPDELARELRRPLPRPPTPWSRRGTAFHAWLEQRWKAQTLLDVDELPGAADHDADDTDLLALRAAFEAGAWAQRNPVDVEVPFEMSVGGRVIRGRMDAVFAEGDGWVVIDWKTGRRPAGGAARAAAVQLAAYRLAWSALVHADPSAVRAAFHYVRSDETVEPAALLDAAGLRSLVLGADE